ncbi:MAG TPA: MtrB/PioB family decaheme-associated outer membrane protein [Thermoanaerobaculia bacterium]|nr:MtrB/PioB family decaheme-associated outer membrane protein [Thermoanaerobaculia bacterium]
MRKHLTLGSVAVLASCALLAQDAPSVQTEGEVQLGVEQIDVDSNSSKFNEYRDLGDGLLLDELWFDLFDQGASRYLEVAASRVDRRDSALWLRAGTFDGWRLDVDWNRTPHLLSNQARSPYDDKGGGLFEVPANIPIDFKKLQTTAADAPGVVASDLLIAEYLDANLRGVPLGTQRDRGTIQLGFGGARDFDVRLLLTDEQRSGSKITYGPIGDRPPRTLNVQLPEPLDYRTRDAELQIDRSGRRHQLGFTYLLSTFDNDIDTLTWENIFATPEPGADFDVWDRAVSAFGRRPLAPDNRFHQATVSYGVGAPLGGRLSAVVSYGMLDQDEQLLPYSFAQGVLVDPTLPRTTADAEMKTIFANVTYTWNPLPKLQMRTFARYYELDNQTPENNWWYVTSDTSNLNGTRSYKNHRTNLAYAYDTLNVGVEARRRFEPLRSTFTVALEREEIAREFREADTDEDRLILQWRARPSKKLSLKTRYAYGDREGDGYNGTVTSSSYWYTPEQVGADNDNPAATFSNHPDMRRYDVADRERHRFDASATWMPRPAFSLSATFLLRDDDYDSDVRPTQPLAGLALADADLFTPGDQLGLLEEDRRRVSLDAAWAPSDRLTLSGFVAVERAGRLQRSLEFNENNKQNPSAVATAELGGWNRPGNQWTADFEDDNEILGIGVEWIARPERITFRADGSWSRGTTDLEYTGFGTTNFDGAPFADNHQFGFRSPPTIESEWAVLEGTVELRLWPSSDLVVTYGYDRYRIDDWQQEANTPWYESVGSEYLLRDTSRSHQWGNRLVNLGSFLAPGYDGHYGRASLAIRF